jgi:hypothetical protein
VPTGSVVNLPVDFQRLIPIIAVGAVALVAAVLVTRGVGGGSTSASAQQVLDRALEQQPRSAALSMRSSFSIQRGDESVTLADTVVTGASADTAKGKPPQATAHLTQHVEGREPVTLDELSTGEAGYLRVDGVWYQLSDQQYQRVFPPDRNGSLVEALGFDPQRWIRNPKVESTGARVGGVEANYISGDVNVDAVLTDLGIYKVDNAGSAVGRQFVETVKNASKHGTMSLFAGKQDGILRRLSVNAGADAAKSTPPVRATITFALGRDKVNQRVAVTAPKGALAPGRIAAIPRAKLGDQANDILGAPVQPRIKPSPSSHAGKRGKSPARSRPKSRSSAQAYISCVQAAPDLQALGRCQSLLP